MHGDSSLVTLWWSDWLSLDWIFLWQISLQGSFEQMRANLTVKEAILHTKTIPNPYFVSYKRGVLKSVTQTRRKNRYE